MRSFRFKFVLYFLILIAFTMVLYLIFFINRSNSTLKKTLIEKGYTLANIFTYSVELGVLTEDESMFASPLKGIFKNEDVAYISVYNKEGDLIGSETKIETPQIPAQIVDSLLTTEKSMHRELEIEDGSTVYEFLAPIISVGLGFRETIGYVRIGLFPKKIERESKDILSMGIMMFLFVILIGFLLSIFLATKISRPLKNLAEIMKDIAEGEGNLMKRMKIETKDEIGVLASSFNKFTDGIEKIIAETSEIAKKLIGQSETVSTSSAEINSSSQQVSSTIQAISEGSTKQAENLVTTVKAVKLVSDLAVSSAKKAEETESFSNSISSLAEIGRGSAEEALVKIDSISRISAQLKEVVEQLSKKSERISSITETISAITKQTNLLALNAAIEAARAGEFGRGFAVVADEVRKLADRTSNEAYQITQIIEEMRETTERLKDTTETTTSEVSTGKNVLTDAAEGLKKIADQIGKSGEGIREIAQASVRQRDEMAQLSISIEDVASIAEENAASSQEVAAAVEEQTASTEKLASSATELGNLSGSLKRMISRFKFSGAE